MSERLNETIGLYKADVLRMEQELALKKDFLRTLISLQNVEEREQSIAAAEKYETIEPEEQEMPLNESVVSPRTYTIIERPTVMQKMTINYFKENEGKIIQAANIVRATKLPPSTISNHMKILERIGFIRRVGYGSYMYGVRKIIKEKTDVENSVTDESMTKIADFPKFDEQHYYESKIAALTFTKPESIVAAKKIVQYFLLAADNSSLSNLKIVVQDVVKNSKVAAIVNKMKNGKMLTTIRQGMYTLVKSK